MKRHDAFTLIELLAVIAIIGILGAILIPVVGNVRGWANSSNCIQNLRQLSMGSQLFSKDNDGLIVPWRYRPTGQGLVYWEESLSPYLDIPESESSGEIPDQSILLCPEEEPNNSGNLAYYEAGYHTNYSINLHIAWNQPGNPEGRNNHFQFRKGHYQHIQYPERTFLFIDLFGPGGGGHWMGPSLVYPHNGKVNVAYVDGHVESKTREEMERLTSRPHHVFWRGYPWNPSSFEIN